MSSGVLKDLFHANSIFCNNYYAALTKTKGNILSSPISAHIILSLVYQGATDEAAEYLEQALKLKCAKYIAEGYESLMQELKSVKRVSLYLANKIFVDERYPVNEQFKSIANKYFLSEAENLNFSKNTEAARSINSWVEDKTNKKITQIVVPGDLCDVPLVLVNAIYFKGDWLYKFKRSDTTKEKFYISETETIDCDMMHKRKDSIYYLDERLDAQIIQLKYKNEKISMFIALPNSRMGIEDLENKFDVNDLSNGTETEIVDLSLPRFKIETTMDLMKPLTDLGLADMFCSGLVFTEMLDTAQPVRVGKIVQKTFIEVNEAGTESTGTLGALGVFMTEAKLEPVFNADHPFMFCLTYEHEENLIPLFIGSYKGVQEKEES